MCLLEARATYLRVLYYRNVAAVLVALVTMLIIASAAAHLYNGRLRWLPLSPTVRQCNINLLAYCVSVGLSVTDFTHSVIRIYLAGLFLALYYYMYLSYCIEYRQSRRHFCVTGLCYWLLSDRQASTDFA